MKTLNAALCLVALNLAACSASSDALQDEGSVETVTSPVSLASNEGIPEGIEYRHEFAHSAFRVGGNPRSDHEQSIDRTVGDTGAFMMDAHTGAVLAVRGATDFAKYPKALTTNASQHSDLVRSYLVSAGIPSSEVAGTHVTTTMAGGGSVADGLVPGKSQLLWYSSHLERALGGIPVEGSFAYAAFDSLGGVINEGVYWPAIPRSVVARAMSLKKKLDNPPERDAFQTAVRASHPQIGSALGQVRIVHTSARFAGAFEAKAAYVVFAKSADKRSRTLLFDENGALTQLADALATQVDSPKQ